MASIEQLEQELASFEAKVDTIKDALRALKKRKCNQMSGESDANENYAAHIAAAEQGDEEDRTRREFKAVLELVKRHFDDPDISTWTCCNSGITANPDVFDHFCFRGACGIKGDDKGSIEFLPTFPGYVQALAVHGGVPEEGLGFDMADPGFEFAASNIDGRIASDYQRRFNKVTEGVAELHKEGIITTSAVTYALDGCGEVCDLFLH